MPNDDNVPALAHRFQRLKQRRYDLTKGLLAHAREHQDEAARQALHSEWEALIDQIREFDAIRAPGQRSPGDKQLKNLQRAVSEMERLWPPIERRIGYMISRLSADTAVPQ